ncbi:unnamed protein product [Lactuca virosa]|uniref:Uncharacterized protein n=1 Tax=Lactuca virosa TaxID=75947 RepID=A0AAU9LLV7_9ASTR|nr:unnamed protein product [Lactuca virosa]
MSRLQVLGTVASIMEREYRDDWAEWKVATFAADYASCVVMFIPMYWSILSLKEARETDWNAARNLSKLSRFVMVAVGYVYFTRIVFVMGMGTIVDDKWPWAIDAATETSNCMVVMFYMYMPLQIKVDVLGDDQEVGL